MVKRRVCFMCGKELSEGEAVPVYKEVLDRESGELKSVVDYYLCKPCYAIVKKRSI
ncbi:MAG: hypothetical protein QXX41_05230 [Nitrososphaerota archaeon]